MKRLEGGYLGGRPTWSLASNPGIWGIEQVYARRAAGTWPIGGGSFDEFYEYVTFTLHADGANGSTSFPDSSLLGNAVAVNGNAQVSTTQSKFGGSSISFDGSGDYLVASSSSAFALQAGDWTIECWVYFNVLSGYQNIIDFRTTNGAAICPIIVSNGSNLQFDVGSTNRILAAGVLAINNWYHIAVSKSGNSTRMFLNGTQVGSTYTDSNSYVNNSSLNIGRYPVSNVSFLNGYVDELRITKGYARYTSNFSVPTGPYEDEGAPLADPFYNYVSLLLPMNGSNNSTTFTDKSPNALTVTANGDAKLNTAVKRYGVSSAYFDGTGDYLDTSVLASPTGSESFTIEAWIYPTAVTGQDRVIFETRGGTGFVFFINTSGYLQVFDSVVGSALTASNILLAANTWQHVALSKSGSTAYYFVNGVSAGTYTLASHATATSCRIGARNDAAAAFAGYIDDLRITKGVARYLTNFIPPLPHADYGTLADPYLAASSLWMPMEGPVDSTGFFDRANRQIVTTAGNTKISNAQYKWGLTSGAFDGTGDYLSIASNNVYVLDGNFTIEFWLYANNSNSNQGIMSNGAGSFGGTAFTIVFDHPSFVDQVSIWNYPSITTTAVCSTGTLSTETWNHVAFTRRGSTVTAYLNGIAGTNFTTASTFNLSATELRIGTYWNGSINGYIDDLRIIKGHAIYTNNFTTPTAPINSEAGNDPYFNNVSLLLKMDGGNNSTTFTDSSPTPKTVSANGNAKISTDQSKFGGASAYFDGTGDALAIPSTADLQFGTGEFTIEAWVYLLATPPASNSIIIARSEYGSNADWIVNITSGRKLRAYFGATAKTIDSVSTIALNQWTHVAVARTGTTVNLFIDGTLDKTDTYSGSTESSASGEYTIGADQNYDESNLNGYIDELRVTKGIARYTANFVPLSIPYPTA